MNRREAGEAERREAVSLIAELADGAEAEDGQEFDDAAAALSGFVQRMFGITAAEIERERAQS